MESMFAMYAIRNVQTGNFVRYMSDDGTQYEETDCNGNFANFENEFQANEYLKKKVNLLYKVRYFEVVKLYAINSYYTNMGLTTT